MSERDGGPAFPIGFNPGPEQWRDLPGKGMGMTLRQWYAGMALMGYRANPKTWDKSSDEIAKYCREDADAQLRAGREGGEDGERS